MATSHHTAGGELSALAGKIKLQELDMTNKKTIHDNSNISLMAQ